MRTAVLAILLFLATAAPAAEDLPFLPAGGWERPETPLAFPLLPEWIDGPAGEPDLKEEEDLLLPDPGRLRPDATDLLDGVEDGAERERLLAAVRAGFARSVRVDVAISAPGGVRTISGTVPEGAVLTVDDREERSYPFDLDFEVKATAAAVMRLRTGLLVTVSPVRLTGDRYALRLGLAISRAGEVHRLRGGRAERLCPEVEFATLVAEVPLAPGREEILVARAPDGAEELRVAVRATPLDSPSPPPGTRVRSLGGLAPLLATGRLPLPGRALPEAPEEPDLSAPEPEVPPAWLRAAGDAVRVRAVPPGLAVLSGPEAALDAADAAVDAGWRETRPALRVTVEGTDGSLTAPILAGRPLLYVRGKTVPVLGGLFQAGFDGMSNAGPRVEVLFVGRTLRVEADREGRARAEEGGRAAPRVEASAWEEGG